MLHGKQDHKQRKGAEHNTIINSESTYIIVSC